MCDLISHYHDWEITFQMQHVISSDKGSPDYIPLQQFYSHHNFFYIKAMEDFISMKSFARRLQSVVALPIGVVT